MFITILLSVIYMSMATFTVAMTLTEHRKNGSKSIFFTSLGLLACAVWPITFIVVAIAAQRSEA